MLADSLTKEMEDVLITHLMKTGKWEIPWSDIKHVKSCNLVNLSPSSVHFMQTKGREADKDCGCGDPDCLCCGVLSRGLSSAEHHKIYWLYYLSL
jgi:hypothetical protein